jgi:hypothetical protein
MIQSAATDDPRPEGDRPMNRRAPDSTAELIRQIHEGLIDAATLPAAKRRACVSYLTFQGLTTAEIAHVLCISDRSVQRDRFAARRAAALRPDSELGDELLGEFQQLTLGSIQRLIRLSNDPSAPAYARMWAEEAMIRNYQRFLDAAAKHRYFHDGSLRLQRQRRHSSAERKLEMADNEIDWVMSQAKLRQAELIVMSNFARDMGWSGDEEEEATSKPVESTVSEPERDEAATPEA